MAAAITPRTLTAWPATAASGTAAGQSAATAAGVVSPHASKIAAIQAIWGEHQLISAELIDKTYCSVSGGVASAVRAPVTVRPANESKASGDHKDQKS